MDKLKLVAAALTIAIGYALVIAAIGIDDPLGGGDGSVVIPGIVLALILSSSPNITDIDSLQRRSIEQTRGSDCNEVWLRQPSDETLPDALIISAFKE